jgi:hypothetical protein
MNKMNESRSEYLMYNELSKYHIDFQERWICPNKSIN